VEGEREGKGEERLKFLNLFGSNSLKVFEKKF